MYGDFGVKLIVLLPSLTGTDLGSPVAVAGVRTEGARHFGRAATDDQNLDLRSVSCIPRDFLAAWGRGDAGPVPCGGCTACCHYPAVVVDEKRDRKHLARLLTERSPNQGEPLRVPVAISVGAGGRLRSALPGARDRSPGRRPRPAGGSSSSRARQAQAGASGCALRAELSRAIMPAACSSSPASAIGRRGGGCCPVSCIRISESAPDKKWLSGVVCLGYCALGLKCRHNRGHNPTVMAGNRPSTIGRP